jgi:hypothetical protein
MYIYQHMFAESTDLVITVRKRVHMLSYLVRFDFDMLAALVMNRILSSRLDTFIVDEE